jgi:putative tryptophan/tyrosine transport system substrate-binding protein
MIRRRDFITLLGGAAAWPMAARGQRRTPVIGFLGAETPDLWADSLRAFLKGLNEIGYTEGRNVTIEYRWASGQNDQLPALAADLVRREVMVIAAPGSTPATLAAKAATATIPIVFGFASNPVELGLVASLARPGGNVTGATSMNAEVAPKRLEFLHELVPTARVMAVLVNPTNPALAENATSELQAAARKLALRLHVSHASSERDLDEVFSALSKLQAGGLVVGNDSFFTARSRQLAALALRHRIPTAYAFHEFAAAGGLMSYGGTVEESFRLAGVYVGRILRGEAPADLPIQQSTKVELILNLKTARALGLTVPLTLRARADEVIE